eukprot:11779032-Ditylum_brightwellii.AAC.1
MSSKLSIPAHPSGETMKAVYFTSFGKPDNVLSVQVIPKLFVSYPEQHETSILSYDVSGVIEQVGEEASKSFK